MAAELGTEVSQTVRLERDLRRARARIELLERQVHERDQRLRRLAEQHPTVLTNQVLTEANGRLRRFAAVMSHDLRSPVLGARAVLALLLDDDRLPDDLAELTTGAHRRLTNLDRLITELHDQATLDLDQIEARPTDVASTLEAIASTVHSRGQRIIVDARVPDSVEVATSGLSLCVRNLVDNACKHHDGQGTVRIAASVVEDDLVVEITDDGPGIPPELLERIFEPRVSTVPDGRSGLGLTHVRDCVDRYGAEIELTSVPGQGTTFTLRWPVST